MSLNSIKMYNRLEKEVSGGLCFTQHCRQRLVDEEVVEPQPLIPTQNLKELAISTAKSCSYCQVTFEDAAQQRSHFKLDWHRFNLKQSLSGRPFVPEEEFSKRADDLSSISGSESDSSSDTDSEEDETRESRRILCFREAKLFVENQTGHSYSLYKCLLVGRREDVSIPTLQERLTKFLNSPKNWMIVMLGGGHFAAAVFEDATMTVHKTFHCYTVRAKQGGSQAARDSKGGNHPKSAGASLRRYNELALVQHVQDIMSSWSENIAKCSLILYRAVGPHNHSVLFGGANPPLDKTDPRLRSIPFTTRRATLKEVQRVQDMLVTLQYHGPSSELQDQFTPEDLAKKTEATTNSPQRTPLSKHVDEHFDTTKRRPSPAKLDRAKERSPRERELPGARDPGDSSFDSDDGELMTGNLEVDLAGDLKEFDDSLKKKKRKKKVTGKQKAKLEKRIFYGQLEELREKIKGFCKTGNAAGLEEVVKTAETWPSREDVEVEADGVPPSERSISLKKEDFTELLRGPVCESSGDTLLHIASASKQPAVVTVLLNAGCDPSVKNRRNQVPYVTSADKSTKAAYKDFVALHPDRFDLKECFIPPPPTEEQMKEMEEKKRAKNKQRKLNEKTKKKEQFERKVDEDEKVRFLALSDREKRALAAEKRIVSSITSNAPKAATPVFVRCFQCGVNITGKVPFEYSTHLFCSINCLKSHRAKTKSYGVEI